MVVKAWLANGPDWEVTSASLAGGRCCKVHPVVEALCCHPLAKGPSAVAGGGVGA